jgi:hypothetical protein
MIALGRENVWICQLGRDKTDGSFQDFIDAISQAQLSVDGLKVAFDSPGNGILEFDWTGPLTLNQVEIPLSGYPRFDNPYAQVDFDSGNYRIELGQQGLFLNFDEGIREMK